MPRIHKSIAPAWTAPGATWEAVTRAEAQTLNPRMLTPAPPRPLATVYSTSAPALKVATMRGSAAGAALCTAIDSGEKTPP